MPLGRVRSVLTGVLGVWEDFIGIEGWIRKERDMGEVNRSHWVN